VSQEEALYKRDPEAWQTHLAEGNRKQARKRVAADVLFRDGSDRILLVDPTYKPDWDLPGGMAGPNEPPLEAARREVKEELGFEPHIERLLCVDWVSPHGPWDDSLVFIFDGGVLGPEKISDLSVVDEELAAFAFYTEQDAAERLRPYVWRRVEMALQALRADRVHYLHDGYEPA
jgi:8-oxo-dGTP diphosphatase